MKFFIDTADLDEIRDLASTGLVDGATTNPSLIAKSGGDFFATIKEICAIVPGPVSAEVTATDAETMVAVEAPLTLETCRQAISRVRGRNAREAKRKTGEQQREARHSPATAPSLEAVVHAEMFLGDVLRRTRVDGNAQSKCDWQRHVKNK